MSNIQNRLKKVLKTLDDKNLSKVAYDKFVELTPVKTGNAKDSTKLRGRTIEANYNYAVVLDKGRHNTNKGMRGSNQAPQGMTKPTYNFIRKYVFKTLGIKI